jgi:hypothetical protein
VEGEELRGTIDDHLPFFSAESVAAAVAFFFFSSSLSNFSSSVVKVGTGLSIFFFKAGVAVLEHGPLLLAIGAGEVEVEMDLAPPLLDLVFTMSSSTRRVRRKGGTCRW